MRGPLRAILAVILALCVASAAAAAKARTKKSEGSEPRPAVHPAQWLVLGPVIDPLPAFHDAEHGGFDVDARLESVVFPESGWEPRAGQGGGWFASETVWREVAAVEGIVSLEAPGGATEGRPATVWLATRVAVDRFRKLDVELPCEGPRRAWIDGRQVASGSGTAEVSADVELIRGEHLLVVECLWTGGAGDWRVGAVLRAADELGAEGVATTLDEARSLTIQDVLDPPRFTQARMSHDSRYVIATRERYRPGTDLKESWLEIYALGLVQTIRGDVEVGQPDWVPRQHRVTYVSSEKTEDGTELSTIWQLDLMSNRVEPLLEGIADFVDYRWVPDGKAIVYRTRAEPGEDERGFKRLEGLMDRWAGHRTKHHLNMVTIPGGMRRRLTAGPVSSSAPVFSPDGKRMMFVRNVEDVSERPYSLIELWEMNLETFEAKHLRDFRWLEGAVYGPDGRLVLLHGGPGMFGETGLDVGEDVVPNSYDGQLFLWDPESDEVRALTRGFDPAVTEMTWNWGSGLIVFTAEDRDRVRLYALDPDGAEISELDTGHDVYKGLSSALASPGVIGFGTSPWQPQALVAVDVVRNLRNTLKTPDAPALERVRTGTVQDWSFESSDGREIDGRVYLPPDFDSERRYPLIVYYYGGTSPVSREFGGRYPLEYWASHGYVVYTLQPSGATGFGQQFSAAHVNDWGKTTAREVIEGTRRFLADHPYVDPERVGCIGASYGGFLTMLLTTETDLFAAAVSHAGISSIASYWGEGYWGWGYGAVALAGSFPWNRPDIYVDQSPLFRADRVRTPILLTHGADDTNVPVGESDQFYVALKLLGKPVEYLQVLGQDHWILDHAKRVVWSRSIVAWFDRWLKDQPQWWDALWSDRP